MSTSTQLPGNEDRAITIGINLGIEDPYPTSKFDKITSTLLSYKAMIWATQGTVFSNPNSDKTTSTLLSYKVMRWAIQGTVFSNPTSNTITSMEWAIPPGAVYYITSLGTYITVSTEDKLTTHLFGRTVQQQGSTEMTARFEDVFNSCFKV
jgi:hypothetical protein